MKNRNFRTQAFLLTSFATLLSVSIVPVYAAVGEVVHITNLNAILPSPPVFCSIGIAVDNQATPRGYVNSCFSGVIHQINLLTGASLDSRDFTAEIPELPNAMAFDASRGGNWICTQGGDATGMPIYFQDFKGTFNTMADDTVTKMFTITSPPAAAFSFNFCDGLAINLNGPGPADDRIYFSDDINDFTEIYDPTGTHIGTISNTLIHPTLAFGSGIAVGGNFLYLANDGGGDVFRANLGANPLQPPLVDMFTSGDDRQEDMECDPITFSPTEVMWVRTTPQGGFFPNVITAFEIEPKTCGIGGGSAPVGGEVLPIDSVALLLAGAQLSAIWMIPLLAGVAGTTAIYLKTRKN
jgi:hypothetical protein